jgi:FkbM family methyltransferase
VYWLRLTAKKGIEIDFGGRDIKISDRDRSVIISKKNFFYASDIIDEFDYYFSAVEFELINGERVVDYSGPRYHSVIGYPTFPIFFPSLCEPLITTQQYIEFGQLRPGQVVLDLGAYSGLTSIMFKEMVGEKGTVVAVDADKENFKAIEVNLDNYSKHRGQKIESLWGAVWNHSGGLEFSSEGSMGSSATVMVGRKRGAITQVPSYTISGIAEKFELDSVDFLKVDVEGAEAVIFEDKDFFLRFKPKIIVETHIMDAVETTGKCVRDLHSYGYECKITKQIGSNLPLLECYPPDQRNSPDF